MKRRGRETNLFAAVSVNKYIGMAAVPRRRGTARLGVGMSGEAGGVAGGDKRRGQELIQQS